MPRLTRSKNNFKKETTIGVAWSRTGTDWLSDNSSVEKFVTVVGGKCAVLARRFCLAARQDLLCFDFKDVSEYLPGSLERSKPFTAFSIFFYSFEAALKAFNLSLFVSVICHLWVTVVTIAVLKVNKK